MFLLRMDLSKLVFHTMQMLHFCGTNLSENHTADFMSIFLHTDHACSFSLEGTGGILGPNKKKALVQYAPIKRCTVHGVCCLAATTLNACEQQDLELEEV